MPKQDVTVEVYYDSDWQDITADDDVFTEPIVIKRGQADESPAPRPSSITMQLANDDDRYRTSNPESPLYGKAGRNTPARVSVGSTVRGIVEASSWAADQTPDFRQSPPRGKAWVDFEGGGLLQRINQWTQPLRSPFYTYNVTEIADVIGYWPMEDARGSTSAASPIAGARNTLLRGVSFESQARPAGSAPLADVVLQDASRFRCAPSDRTSTAGWQYSVVVNMASLGGSFFTPLDVTLADGGAVTFSIDDGSDEVTLLAFDAGGTTRISQTNSYASTYPWSGVWIMFVLQATYSGSTTTVTCNWRGIDEDSGHFVQGTYGEPPSVPTDVFCSGMPDQSAFGHVIVAASNTDNMTDADRFTAFRGHAGEKAAFRFGRLCDENNIAYYVSSSFDDSTPMGPQPVDTLINLFKEIVATDDCLLYDHRTELRLFLLGRTDRYNQTPALTLTPADLPALPKEVTDDLGTHNVVTASQRDGGDYTAEDSTGPLGTQPPPDGVGEARQTVDVNLDDPDTELPQAANWWLRKGTVGLPRYPQITVDLNAKPSLVTDVESVDIGSVIEITGFRENTIRLYVLGYTETIGTHTRTITFTCAPDQQYMVGVYDGTASYTPRYDLATCTLDGDHTSSTTSLLFTIADDEAWSTTAEPYDLFIAGERVTVTSMGARSGSGPYAQTATVTRSVNGVSKALPDGAAVRIATPGRWAL